MCAAPGPSARGRGGDELSSEYDFGTSESASASDAASVAEAERGAGRRRPLECGDADFRIPAAPAAKSARRPHRNEFSDEASRAEFSRSRLLQMDAYSRHKELINQYLLYYPGATKRLQRDTSRDRTDMDLIREHHKFVWRPEDGAETWEKKLSKRYYDKLFKEYAICDLSRYKENKIAMRWRTEKEVVDGKGQFTCGSKQCNCKDCLTSWEVNFAYSENGQRFNELVKLRLCPDCSNMLNYRDKKKLASKRPRAGAKVKRSGSKESSLEPTIDAEQLELAADREKDARLAEEAKKDAGVWSQPAPTDEPDKSREQEFDEFLHELFM